MICIKMGVPFPGGAALTSMDVKQRSGYFNKTKALYLPFSSKTRIPAITSYDDAVRKDEPAGHVSKCAYLCVCT